MKRKYSFAIAAAVVLILVALGLVAYHRHVPSVKPVQKMADRTAATGSANVLWSPYGEQALEVEGEGLSASHGARKELPTASIAKVMTALAVLKKYPLSVGQQGPSMTMTTQDVQIYQQELSKNESVVKVAAGEQLTEYEALEAMLVPSATNVGDTTATWAFGSIANYLDFANDYAAKLGMTHTHFGGDASGFSPETVSTPQDLLLLGEAALKNPVIAQIVSQRSVTLPVAGTMQNFNIDLGVEGIIGIKTGNTDQAGGALLFGAKYGTHTVIGAIMGEPDLGTALHDAPEVLKSFEANVQDATVVHAGQTVGQYTLPWGGTVNAVAQKDIKVTSWTGSRAGIKIALNDIDGAQRKDAQVGTLTATYDGTTQTTPIVLAQSASSPNLFWRLFH